MRGRESQEQLFLKSFFWLIDNFFHVIIEKFRHSAPFVMKEYMLKKLQMSAVFLSTLYLTLQFRKHPNENWHLAKVAYAGWTNGSGWPGWPASYPTSVRWHPFIAPAALVGRMHAQIQNNISESVQTNLRSILDPELVYYYSQVLIKIVKVCSWI